LVSEDDFQQISLNNSSDSQFVTGTLHLYNFENWRNSAPIAKEVQDQLWGINGRTIDDRYHRVSTRIEAYETAVKSINILIFLILYISTLLYAAAILMIHFKLGMEKEEDQRKLHTLHRIGITGKEISAIVSSKIAVVFLTPLTYSVVLTILYSYYVNSSYGYGWIGVGYSCLCAVALICVHMMLCKIYSYRACVDAALACCTSREV
jgi:putative ABC transport system permease protein